VFSDIQAPDGTKAKEGKDTNVTVTVMPEEEETYLLSADVEDFEMDPIDISAAPAAMSIDDPDLADMKGDMHSLSSGISDINQGVGDLNQGISSLHNGAQNLQNGSSDYRSGINELAESSDQLVNGSKKIRDTLKQV